MRSTTAPEIRAGVMMANVPWKHMNSRCGMAPGANASDYPSNAHAMSALFMTILNR